MAYNRGSLRCRGASDVHNNNILYGIPIYLLFQLKPDNIYGKKRLFYAWYECATTTVVLWKRYYFFHLWYCRFSGAFAFGIS